MKPTKQELEKLYNEQKLGSHRISKRYGVAKITVLRWLKKHKIPIRTGKEAHQFRGKDVWPKGGRIGHVSGYIRVWVREKKKYEWEHRVLWEKHHGKIPRGMCVHHKNLNKSDNRIENLELLPCKVHDAYHTLKRWREKGIKDFGRHR